MPIDITRLRYIKSKDIDNIVNYVNSLVYKIELKSLIYDGKKYCQSFVLPENEIKEAFSGDLD